MPNPFNNPVKLTDSQSIKSDKSAVSTESAEISEDFVSSKNVSELSIEKSQKDKDAGIGAAYRDYEQTGCRRKLKEDLERYFSRRFTIKPQSYDRVVDVISEVVIGPKEDRELTPENFETSWKWMFRLVDEWWSLSSTNSPVIKKKDMYRVLHNAYKNEIDDKSKNDSSSKANSGHFFCQIYKKFPLPADGTDGMIDLHVFLRESAVKNAIYYRPSEFLKYRGKYFRGETC